MAFSKNNIIIVAILVVLGAITFVAITQFEGEPVDFVASGGSQGRCNVGVVSISGHLATYDSAETVDSLRIAQVIRSLDVDASKKAVVLLVNSSGGSAAAAEEIAGAIDGLDVPSVALVREYALSGGYWIAASTDHIVALSTSLVGNVGVTGSYLEETALNALEGFTYREITSGEFKDVGNVNKLLTPRHRQFLQDNVDDLFGVFKEALQEYRGLSEERLAEISDGKFYIAELALGLDLIDEIGGIDEVKGYLGSELAVAPDNLLLCEPEILQAESNGFF